VNHDKSTAEPYDGEWHHVLFVQEEGERRVYVDGELDDVVLVAKPEGFNPISLNARNGVGNEYTAGDFSVEFGGVYNFWIDVENKTNEDGDVYTVYIARRGKPNARSFLKTW
jgi:hypothetical protein